MSAGLSLIQNLEPTAPSTPALTSVPSSAAERVDAAWGAAQTGDRYWNIQGARKDKAARIIDDYHAVTGERLRNPFDMAPTMEEIRENPGQPTTAIYAKRLEVLRQKTAELRSTMPDVAELPGDYLNADSIDSQIGRESRGARERDEALTGTGNGIPAFIASAGGEMASPHGVLSAFLPVSRMPLAAAERTLAGFARNVGREALFQAGINVAAQIPASVIDYNTRRATGSEQTHEQLVDEFVSAAVGGALLGGLFRGAHLTIRRLQGKGIDLPPAVRDAALVVESRDLYGDKNALGVPAAAHEAALDRAVADVSRGRSADVADVVGVPPTIHEQVRETHPELMQKYDALAEEVRVARQTIENYPEEMQQQLAKIEAEMIAEPRTGSQVAEFTQRIRQTEAEIKAAQEFAAGTGPEPQGQASMRAQLQVIDAEMRDMIPKIREAHAGIERAAEPVRRLEKMMEEPITAVAELVPFTPPEEPAAGRPTGESPQDKTMQAQVKQLLDEGGGATPEHRRQYEAVLQQEKEARIAASCVGGGAI